MWNLKKSNVKNRVKWGLPGDGGGDKVMLFKVDVATSSDKP